MKETWYDQEEDILNLEIKAGAYWKSIELPNGFIIDIDKHGGILSIEIIKASEVFSGENKMVLATAREPTR